MCSKWDQLYLKCARYGMCIIWNMHKQKGVQTSMYSKVWSNWNVIKMEFDQNGICFTIWNVHKMECDQNWMWSKWNVTKMECDQNGIWPKRNVLKIECSKKKFSQILFNVALSWVLTLMIGKKKSHLICAN